MSASARFAPARAVRRQYPKAYTSVRAGDYQWEICAAPVKRGMAKVLGWGHTRLAAWRHAASRVRREDTGG